LFIDVDKLFSILVLRCTAVIEIHNILKVGKFSAQILY
jgi:hypothetical protein